MSSTQKDLIKYEPQDLEAWDALAKEGRGLQLPQGSLLLKFNGQDGRWTAPKIDDDLSGEEMLADTRNLHRGFVKFEGKKLADVRLVKAPAPVPQRSTLGDVDPSTWEIGLNGKAEDPWKLTFYLPMCSRQGSDLFVFTTQSVTGRRAVQTLCADYAAKWRAKEDPDRLPVVRLERDQFKSKFGSQLFSPVFEIVAWRLVDQPDVEAIAAMRSVAKIGKAAPAKKSTKPAREPVDDFDDDGAPFDE